MSAQNTTWPARLAVSSNGSTQQPTEAPMLPGWLTNGLLALASMVLFVLACASAWLSYGAQVAYVGAHNGGQAAQARVWALLLDAGTAGVSLLRLYETLRRRRGPATRVSLFGCIAASVTMNLLHAPSQTGGGYLVAAVPPVIYAAFLEHLLANLRSVLIAEEQRRTVWRTLILWINFPALMWSARRESLRREAAGCAVAPEAVANSGEPVDVHADGVGEVARLGGALGTTEAAQPQRRSRRGRGPGAKRIAFEAALTDQLRAGDLRLLSDDERERNAAAYEAAASLPAPLSQGAARRYVVQALPRLQAIDRRADGCAPSRVARRAFDCASPDAS